MTLKITLLVAVLLGAFAFVRSDSAASEAWLKAQRSKHHKALLKFLKFPTISADPSRAGDILAAAKWLRAFLAKGKLLKTRILKTGTAPPAVFAERKGHPMLPTLLLYGHLDVQPPGPPETWTSPAFGAEVRDGRIYARGASDDKGSVMAAAAAVRAYAATTKPGEGIGIKLFVETEEEIGSPHMPDILEEHKETLSAHYAFSVDGGQISRDQPGLCLGLRGAAAVAVDVEAAKADAHSGVYGGGVPNPLHVLASLVAKLHDENGRIAIPGFYDDVRPMTEADRELVRRFPLPAEEAIAKIGAKGEYGEKGYNFYERTWFRPTVEVGGMGGGFQGKGIKTVLPAKAFAKISLRLVAGQTPPGAANRVKEFIEEEGAKIDGVRVTVSLFPFAGYPYEMDRNTPGNTAAAHVLKGLYGKEPVGFRLGGSIPFMASAKQILGIDTTMLAIAYPDENIHGPNEHWEVESAAKGEIAYVRLFDWFQTNMDEDLHRAGANKTGKEAGAAASDGDSAGKVGAEGIISDAGKQEL